MSATRPLGTIATVGAGMSALGAATRLKETGARVVMFDKGRGPGGRMSTRRQGEYVFDHGAQYFTVRDARFKPLIENLMQAGAAEVWGSTIAVIDGDQPVGAAESVTRYVGTPGMNALVASLASDMDVRFGTPVEGLRRESDHWVVSGDGGRLLGEYEIVLVSIPPAQALELFDPGVPALGRIGSIRMNPCWAVMAAFEKPLRLPFEAAMIRQSPLSWVSRNASKPQRSDGECWVLHGSAEWSARHIDSGPDEVCTFLLEALSKATSTVVPTPAFIGAHRWRYARVEQALGIDSLWDPRMALGICGDWCLGARVEAAYLSLRDKRAVPRQDWGRAVAHLSESYKSMTEGLFPPHPYQDHLCNRCGYAGLCRKEIEEQPSVVHGETA